MENIVQSYLSRYFEIDTSEVGNDGVYALGDKRKIRPPIYGNKLIDELSTVFGVAEKDGKHLINAWAIKIKPKIDLKFYWSNTEDIFSAGMLPVARQVISRTIGMDIVSVKPLSTPSGELLSYDFKYIAGIDPIDERENDIPQIYEIQENKSGEIWDNINKQFDGELDHPEDI